jgi:Zn-dependent protease
VSDDHDRSYEPVTAPEPATLPSEHHRDRRTLLGRLIAPLVVLVGIVVKFGAFVLKFFGIFLAVGGYALIWGWRFAAGFVLLILVHELGHYVEAKRSGLDPQLPVFIPFLGAYVALRNMRLILPIWTSPAAAGVIPFHFVPPCVPSPRRRSRG